MFKDLKQGYPVYILDKDKLLLTEGKVANVGFPRMDINATQPAMARGMVVDVTIEAGENTATYAMPDDKDITFAGNLILTTRKDLLSPEVEAVKNNAEKVLASVDELKEKLKQADALLAELNPVFKEKAENEKRFSSIESAIGGLNNSILSIEQMLKGISEQLK